MLPFMSLRRWTFKSFIALSCTLYHQLSAPAVDVYRLSENTFKMYFITIITIVTLYCFCYYHLTSTTRRYLLSLKRRRRRQWNITHRSRASQQCPRAKKNRKRPFDRLSTLFLVRPRPCIYGSTEYQRVLVTNTQYYTERRFISFLNYAKNTDFVWTIHTNLFIYFTRES